MEMKEPNFMLKPVHLFKALPFVLTVFLLTAGSAQALEIEKQETGLYRDVFDQTVFYEGTNLLRFDRLYRLLFNKKTRSLDANIYDEIPDSNFFVNRHFRSPLSASDLAAGYRVTPGPDVSSTLTVYKGKNEGQHSGFFVRDSRGDEYLFKFDPFDNFELTTSAEVIASRFYYAIGYHVPQYDVVSFDPALLVPAPDARVVDDTGFNKPLTAEKLAEMMLFIPRDHNGHYRASASKILKGENKGYVPFTGRRSDDPEDLYDHERLRTIRALSVFSYWLGNNDVRESNTLDYVISDEKGKEVLRHYIIDFSAALGSSSSGAKAPMIMHEYMVDYGETAKAYLALGLWEKPWQKRWREAGEKPNDSPAIGYFDNRYFDPAKAKMQLPYMAFKDLTRADGFWAAKIINSFSNDDIRTLVGTGKLSRPEDAEYLVGVLAERRDIIARYWFEKASPLDAFEYKDHVLSFHDLAVEAGFTSAEARSYHVEVIQKTGKKGKRIASLDLTEPSLRLDPAWFSPGSSLHVFLRASRSGTSETSAYVLVELDTENIQSILHQD